MSRESSWSTELTGPSLYTWAGNEILNAEMVIKLLGIVTTNDGSFIVCFKFSKFFQFLFLHSYSGHSIRLKFLWPMLKFGTSLTRQPLLLKKRERVWGIVHIQFVPVMEFPNTNQIAECMNVYRKNVINVLA